VGREKKSRERGVETASEVELFYTLICCGMTHS